MPAIDRTLAIAVALFCGSVATAVADAGAICGTIVAAPELADAVRAGDRLVIKIYAPDRGVENDTKYRIIPAVRLPLEFTIAPTVAMSGRPRWRRYVVEAFTDRDGDVLGVAPGEISGGTGEPVPLGSCDVRVVLDRRR